MQTDNLNYALATDGANWPAYRDRMDIMLAAHALGDHLTNADIPTSKSYPGAKTGDSPMTATERWEVDDALVKHYIATSIPDAVFVLVKGKSAKDFWDNMVRMFEGRSNGIRFDLSRTIYKQRCGENTNVRTHFAKLNDLRERHAAAGGSIPDGDYARILLASLPPSYGPTISTITAPAFISKKELDPFVVIRITTNEYERRISLAADASKSKAIQKKGRNVAL